MRSFLLASLAALLVSGTGLAQQSTTLQKEAAKADPAAPLSDAQVIAQQLPCYPITTCPISNEPLDSMGKPMDLVHEGRLVRFCCKSCVREFKKDPAPTLK